MNLVEFLEARIAEDEAQLASTPRAAQQFDDFDYGGTDDYLRFTIGYGRAVAECAAKRAIMERYEKFYATRRANWMDPNYAGAMEELGWTLEALAAVYHDHPDYQQEWSDAT